MAETEIVIFDMDGTLYDLSDVVSMNYNMQIQFYSKCSGKRADSVVKEFEDNNIYSFVTPGAKSATEYFARKGLDMEEWQKYREEHFDVTRIVKEKAVSDAVIRLFKERYVTLILTSNSYENVKKVLEWLGISEFNFDMIICSNFNYPYEVFCKKKAFEYISQKYGVPFFQMLSIGDRYHTDIEPLIQLGGKGIIVNRPIALELVASNLLSSDLDTNSQGGEYRYFCQKNLAD